MAQGVTYWAGGSWCRAANVLRTPVNGGLLVAVPGNFCPHDRRPKTGDDQAEQPGHLVVGTGVDPVTFRFSGGRSAN